MSRRRAIYAVLWLLLGLFFGGFYLGEDSLGGGVRMDLYEYHGPTMFAFRDLPWRTVLANYTSATTPLFQMLESYNPLLGNDLAFRATNLLVGLLTVCLFTVALRQRFPEEQSFQLPAMLIGASFLLSPYFRAETFWVSTDILPLLLTIICSMLLTRSESSTQSVSRSIGTVSLIAIVSWAAFYCRQSYAFLPAYACIVLLVQRKSLRWFTIAIFSALALPAAWLFTLWRGFNPPAFHSHQKTSADGVIAPLSIIFVYASPFAVCAFLFMRPALKRAWIHSKGYLPWITIGWVLFLLIFHQYRFNDANRGGGILSKLLSQVGTPGVIAFLTCSYLGLLILIYLVKTSSRSTGLFIVLAMIPTFVMAIVYQRYYDPTFVLFFLYLERRTVRPFVTVRMASLLMSFNALLLVSALAINSRHLHIFFPITSSAHPWTGTPLDGKLR